MQRLIDEFLIQGIIDNRQVILITLAIAGKEIFEYWLGKTQKVEAGSTLEMILIALAKIKDAFKK